MIHHINLAWLHEVAKDRKPGYLEACMKRGKANGDFLQLTDADYMAIKKEFGRAEFGRDASARRPPLPHKLFQGAQISKPLGLGDAIHKIAGPIGRAINWPCMKGDGTTDLKLGSPCAKIRDKLNRII